MEKVAYNYTVVRYLSDVVKNEPRNLGVIVQCSALDYINCKFTSKLHGRLGSTASKLDMTVIKSFFQEFQDNYKPFSQFPSTKELLPNRIKYLKEDYLADLSKQTHGKIQFTEPRGGLTSHPEKEVEFLFNTFIGEEKSKEKEHHSKLKTEIKQLFGKQKWLASNEEKERFQVDKRVSGGTLRQDLIFDFALQNGKLYLLETVDLRTKDEPRQIAEPCEAIAKFAFLQSQRKERIETYSVVATPDENIDNIYLKMLQTYSTVFHYTNEKERKRFMEKMSLLIRKGQDLFRHK